MPALSRRTTLRACAALLAAGAGCNGEPVSSSQSEPGTPSGEVHTDLETHVLRAQDPNLVVVEAEGGGEVRSLHPVVDESDLEGLRFVREPEGTADARSFAAETAFGRESLLVVQQPVGQCHRHEVNYVERAEDSFRVDLCRVLRDASVPCESDVRELQVTFARLPFAFEERPTEYSVGTGSNCRRPDGGDRA